MQTIVPTEFKGGKVLLLDGAPHVIEEFHLAGTAQTKPKVHARLRNVKTGRFVERVFLENERVPVVQIEHRNVQFCYEQGDVYVFLDTQTFDELDLSAEQVGERRLFLHENDEVTALFLEGKLLDIVLPESVALEVVETAPPHRGGHDAAWKTAKLRGGLEILVPLFIAAGDVLRVDTRTRKYLHKQTEI